MAHVVQAYRLGYDTLPEYIEDFVSSSDYLEGRIVVWDDDTSEIEIMGRTQFFDEYEWM